MMERMACPRRMVRASIIARSIGRPIGFDCRRSILGWYSEFDDYMACRPAIIYLTHQAFIEQ
jgi:hypothetical protein